MSTSTSHKPSLLALAALALAAFPATAQVTLYGTNSNFDVVNDTGQDCRGFEIEYHGVSSVTSYYNWNRYGPPQVTPLPQGGGMLVRWMSPYDPASGTWVTGTPQAIKPTVMTGHQCIIGTAGYTTSGCEHFGLGLSGNPTRTVYRWLIADPANPGKLIGANSQVAIPAPIWSVQPPPAPAEPAVVVVDIPAPVPPPPAKLYGPAQWMKTYKTEIKRQVNLDELVADNPVVPEDLAQLETSWDLIQADLDPSNGKQKRKRGGLQAGSKAVVRRFEMYKYTGAYDPITNQALCADALCNAPAEGEVGDFIGAQNAAANLNAPDAYPVSVTITGDGQVEDATRVIRCPGACSMTVNTGTQVTLTARNGKGVFSGWGGACAGNSLTCTFSVNSDAPVTALFKSTYKLVLKTNGTGTVSSNPSGGSFLQGTQVTVTAVPGAGATWKGWTGGGCSGLALTCTTTINADTVLTANFR